MEIITSAAGLKNAIQLLEIDQAVKGKQLKEQFYLTYESFKPINLLKRTLQNISSSPIPIGNILGTAMGLATGSLSKKIVVGSSVSILRKLLGSILQVGVTSIVAQHPEKIKLYSQAILQYFFRKKVSNSKYRD